MYLQSSDEQLLALANRGITVIVASGDDGSYSARSRQPCKQFIPVYPASSPYVSVCSVFVCVCVCKCVSACLRI